MKNELTSIMKLKTNQVLSWREERKSEARFFYRNKLFLQDVQDLQKNKNPENESAVRTWLSTMQENHYYSILIFDTSGKQIFEIGRRKAPAADFKKLDSALVKKDFWIDDLQIDSADNFIYMNMYVPLIRQPGNNPFAVMVLVVNPYDDLYPIIKNWPGIYKTAEALFYRRDGDSILYLNELRSLKMTPLKYRLPLSMTELPAAKVISGVRGIFSGIDYRGKDVLASGDNIPGTEWFLIAKIDKDEINDSLYLYSALTIIIIIVLLLAIAALISLLTWRRESSAYKKLYKTEQEKLALKEHYEHLIKHANDIILLMDYEGNIIDANERAIEMYGYSGEEFLTKKINDLRVPEKSDQVISMGEYLTKDGVIYESVHKKKNGGTLYVEASSRVIDVKGNKFVQNIIRDITERKLNEQKIRKLNRLYAYLSKVNECIIQENNSYSLYKRLCAISVETAMFIAAGIAFYNRKNKTFRFDAFSGNEEQSFMNLEHTVKPESENPILRLLVEGKYFISNEVENDALLTHRRDETLKRGYKSIGLFPIDEGTDLLGIFMLFSGEKNFFDDEEINLLRDVSENISHAAISIRKDEERKIAEEALKRSELNLKTLAANIPDTITFLYNNSSSILSAEGSAGELNSSLNNYEGKNLKEIFRKYDVKPELFMNVFRDVRTDSEIEMGRRIFCIQAFPVKNEQGKIEAGLAVFQDITSRKRSEAALRSSESRLKGFFNLNNVFMGIIELRDNEIYHVSVNSRLASLFNKSPEEIKGKSVREISGESVHYYWIDIYRNVLKYRRPVSVEYPASRDGRQHWVLLEINAIENEQGKTPLFSIVGFDITERKLTEEALRQSEERFRSFFESNIIGIIFGDIYGKIKFANNKFLEITGYSRDDLEKGLINWMKITPPEYADLDTEKVKEAMARGDCEPYHKEYYRKDGQRVQVLVGFVLVGDNREESIAYIQDSSVTQDLES